MILLLAPVLVFWSLNCLCQASSSNPWNSCPTDKHCRSKFANGVCDDECSGSQCLRDGFDCLITKETCNTGYIQYCRDHYDNSHCEQGCNNAPCGWDGSDCSRDQHQTWSKGALVVQTAIPFQNSPFQNSSLLWALSVLIQTSVKLRGVVPFQPGLDLNNLDPQMLVDLHRQAPNYKSNGSLLFLQVHDRPCPKLRLPCFPYASEVADFLNAVLELKRTPVHVRAEIQALIRIRGINEELTVTEYTKKETEGSPAWLWPVVGIAVGVGITLKLVALVVFVWIRRRRNRREGEERVHHRSTATNNEEGKAWIHLTSERKELKGRTKRENEKKSKKKKEKKKVKELGKKRREPLGEDAIRMRPLKKTLDIGSDTDMTQSSMEDISKTICDHRSPAQKHFNIDHQQLAVPTPPRRWDRNPIPTHQRTPSNSAPVQWCGPDGSVVLIRAVRSGLDRVVLELLRAGVPVNNTDHTGRSALHWACSVNHLSLARTLIRYGAAVDMQDHKVSPVRLLIAKKKSFGCSPDVPFQGETPLFLSALHGCYETARLLLLNGANQELTDRRGRRPIDVSQNGVHHQLVELLLGHRVQRSPFPVAPTTEVLWDDRGYLYSPWVASPPCLPGRSASFSGVVGPRDMASPQPSDWQIPSPQNWRPMANQSTTALVSPRILGRPSRPISTLQEVTSEAEDEDKEAAREVLRATTPHFASPQPAPRQRSFSCTQPALQRRYSSNQHDPPPNVLPEKLANEHVEIVVVPNPKASSSQSRTIAEPERENKKSGQAKSPSETANNEPKPIQTVM